MSEFAQFETVLDKEKEQASLEKKWSDIQEEINKLHKEANEIVAELVTKGYWEPFE